MSKQFNEYAEIYDEFYSAAVGYGKEVEFYDRILREHGCRKILEVGCGCGNRGKFFLSKGYGYTGLDVSGDMLRIGRQKYPQLKFIQEDVRKLQLNENFDAIMFLGKGSAYLSTDNDFISALKAMRKHVDDGAIIIDGFDADFIIPNFKEKISWSKKIGGKTITRQSVNKLNPKYPNSWDRKLTYIVEEDGKEEKYADSALLRAFSGEELKDLFGAAGIPDTSIINNGDTVIAVGKV